MWKILKTAILVVTNIHTINKYIPWPLAHLKTTGPGDGTNDVGGWYEILAQSRAAFACGQGEESGLEIAAIPRAAHPNGFWHCTEIAQGRDVALRYQCFVFSLLHMLLFEMKGNALSNVSRWKMQLRSRKHLGWCMVARKSRVCNEFDFFLFTDIKLIIQTLALEVKPQPCSATAPYKDRLVPGLADGLSFLHQC